MDLDFLAEDSRMGSEDYPEIRLMRQARRGMKGNEALAF